MVIFPLVAFLTAASVYAFIAYKAVRMRGPQIDHLANLPFSDQSETHHDAKL